jgi:hypothetical protein
LSVSINETRGQRSKEELISLSGYFGLFPGYTLQVFLLPDPQKESGRLPLLLLFFAVLKEWLSSVFGKAYRHLANKKLNYQPFP